MSNVWMMEYRFKSGSIKPYSVIEPSFYGKTTTLPDGKRYFATESEAREAFKNRLIAHVEATATSIKNTVFNETLRKRLKQYGSKEAIELLDALESILKSIPDKIQ